jgi:VWFA-related protein
VTPRRLLLVVMAVATIVASTSAQQSQRVFRAGTSIVTVDVSVLDGSKLVRGLTAADFEVLDDGVTQQLEMLDVESLPLDLTVIVDTSGSVEPMTEDIRLYVKNAAEVLRIDDRFRLITFAGDVHDVFGLRPATETPPVEAIGADGATSIYDALMAGLMRTRRGDRRQLLVAFTDGIETNSAMDLSAVQEVARRSDSVLDIFIVKQVFPGPQPVRYLDTRGYWLTRAEYELDKLGDVARATGGWLDDVYVRPQLPERLKQTLEDFRTSYVLRYRPEGVTQQGWHTIDVRVRSGSYKVRARSGYYWGAPGSGSK